MSSQPICPICNQDDRVAKVSAIYIQGVEATHATQKKAAQAKNNAAAEQAALFDEISLAELEALSKRLKPPASRAEAFSRPIHPDQMILVFSLIVVFILYNVWTSQPASMPLILAVLAAFYGFYFWRRKAILERFEKRRQAQAASDARVHRAVERWMRIYYCARDECVFDPASGDSAPVDQMPGLVFKA